MEVEVYPLHEHIGGYEYAIRTSIVEHGAIVAYALYRTLVLRFYVFGESLDEAELTQFGYFQLLRFKGFKV